MGKKHTGLKRIVNSVGFSIKGIRAALKHEAAFRQEMAVAVIAIPASFWVSENNLERIAMITVTLMVLVVELLNSAVESVVDRISDENHELSGRAKDMGSAAVFLSLVAWWVVWGPMLYRLVSG